MFSWFLISCSPSRTISLNFISAFQQNFKQSESEKGVFLQKNRGASFYLAVAAMSLGGGGAGDSGGGVGGAHC